MHNPFRHPSHSIGLGVIFAVISAAVLTAQTPARTTAAAGQKPAAPSRPVSSAALTNQDVIDLKKAGFSDDLLMAQVRGAKDRQFDLSAKGLIALKAAGVSERVLSVMMDSSAPARSAVASRPPANSVQSPGAAQHIVVSNEAPSTRSVAGREAGIYVEAGGTTMQLEPTVFSGGKTSGVFVSILTRGIKKMAWKAVVRSATAVQRVGVGSPVFYFYFERSGAGLSNTGVGSATLGASSPNEFVLARMTPKRNERELIVGEMGAFGANSGTRSKDTIDFATEKLQPGVYRVTLPEPLPPGEYCFFYAAGASKFMESGTGKLFDFGID